ncbi:MAG TPA: M56 family metallopeptidase [Candidatus Coprenecus merdipullorum]|nr:M56 family metallopeptidase [Candidatus Coprenecus merdipullorum]
MIPWLIRSTLLLTAFYAFFMLFMRRTTLFRLNRIILLAGTAVCMLLPLLRFNAEGAAAMLGLPSPAEVLPLPRIVISEALATGSPEEVGTAVSGGFDWRTLLLWVYAAGCAAALTFTGLSLLRILRVIRDNPGFRYKGRKVHTPGTALPSFSFLNHIVISRSDYERHPEILLHEYMHTRLRHSADILLMSLVCALYWFNPLVWIMLSELRMLHEYETDEAVLKHGIDATQYQLLLVRKAVGDRRFLIANSFNHCKLKNRITMMQKLKTSKWAALAWLACLPLLTLILSSSSAVDTQNSSSDSAVPAMTEPAALPAVQQEVIRYDDVDVKPKFNGGDMNEFVKWCAGQLKYPEEAKNAKISGRVIVQFIVGPDGSLSDIHITRGIDELNGEALRVISLSPAWTPGYENGKPVPVTINFPIYFQLPDE